MDEQVSHSWGWRFNVQDAETRTVYIERVYIDLSVCWTIIMYYFLCSPVTAGSMMKYCAAAARRKRKSKGKQEVGWTCVVASHEIFLRLHFTPEIFFYIYIWSICFRVCVYMYVLHSKMNWNKLEHFCIELSVMISLVYLALIQSQCVFWPIEMDARLGLAFLNGWNLSLLEFVEKGTLKRQHIASKQDTFA